MTERKAQPRRARKQPPTSLRINERVEIPKKLEKKGKAQLGSRQQILARRAFWPVYIYLSPHLAKIAQSKFQRNLVTELRVNQKKAANVP